MPFLPQMPSSWLSSFYNLPQHFVAANPQVSACFHSSLHHFKSGSLSLDSKHVLVSCLGFGPPQSNTIHLLLVLCPSGRKEQERDTKCQKLDVKDTRVHSKPLLDFFFLVAECYCTCFVFFHEPYVWSPAMMAQSLFCVFIVLLFLFL